MALRHGATPPAGGPADPRGALDHLFVARQVTQAQYDAGLFYAALDRRRDAPAEALRRSCVEALARVEIDLPALVRAVCLYHQLPLTVEGTARLRSGLTRLAAHLEQLEDALTEPRAAA